MEPLDKTKILHQIATQNYLPSLSPLTLQLIDVAANELSSIVDLTRIIEQDPGLTARLLKIVNSAFYAHKEEISSISYAVMVAGFKKIRMMALNISLKDTFPLGKVNGMDYDFFWKTSLYRAILSQELTKGSYLCTRLDHEEVFTAGLILELGLLLLFHVCPESLKDSFPGGNVSLGEAITWEEENLGINHRELGRLTLHLWHFPEQIVEIQGIFGAEALQEGQSDLCRVLEIARICTQLFLGSRDDFVVLREIAGILKMEVDRVSEILSEAFFKVEDLARELRLQVNSNNDILEVMEKANSALVKINGSLEKSLDKVIKLFARDNQERTSCSSEIPEEQQKNIEKALDAVAHEIRNPLMVIGGFAQRLVKKSEEQVNVAKYAELISQESRRLELVLNDLLAYSNPYQPAFQLQNLVSVLGKSLEGLQDLITKKNIIIEKNFQKSILPISLDGERFQKSFQLLLETFIPLVEKRDKTIFLSLKAPPATPDIRIEIRFQGEPLNEETKKTLLGEDFSNRTFGQGLALPMSRKIIEAHGGRIELNLENEESRVTIHFPGPARF
jgi:HD-like signal output (HDOD) protein/nitrogen-specific signal transduction histidine kinase